jgi:hypothetical protein
VVPNPCWRVEIRSVRRRGDELLVVSELVPPPPELLCTQQLARVEQTLGVRTAPPRSVRHFVLGSAFARADPGADVTFVHSPAELERLLEGSEPLSGFESGVPPR